MREERYFPIWTGKYGVHRVVDMGMKLLQILLMALFAGTQYALWFGDKNVFDLYRLKEVTAQTRLNNAELEQRTQRLIAEVIDLKESGETLETIARSELGLIKEGEIFYQVIEY